MILDSEDVGSLHINAIEVKLWDELPGSEQNESVIVDAV